MAKIPRATQLIFGSSAAINQIAEFGSLAAGTPTLYSGSTATVANIQALSNFLTGWFGAILGSNSPAIEDMNALFYLVTAQLAYGFQAGIPEWDAGTTYYIGSMVNSAGTIYMSLQNTNINNAVTNGAYWGAPIVPGSVTPTSVPSTQSLPASATTAWHNLTIPSPVVLTIPSTAFLLCATTLTVASGATLTIASGGIARVF